MKLKLLFIVGALALGYELATMILPLPWSKEIDINVTACVYEGEFEQSTHKLGEVPVSIKGKWSNKLPANLHGGGRFEGTIEINDESLLVDTLMAEEMNPFLFFEIGSGDYLASFPGNISSLEDTEVTLFGEFTKYFKTFKFYHYEEEVYITTCQK